jgi:leucyl aminopeptidase
MEFQSVTGSPLEGTQDVFGFIVFGDPSRDATFKLLDKALGGVLSSCAKDEHFEGKSLQSLCVLTHGKLPHKRVLVIGAGPRSDFRTPALRDLAACAAATANKAGASSLALQVPPGKDGNTYQLAVEGVILGSYRFDRYLTGEDARRPLSLKTVGLILDTKGKKPTAAQVRGFQTAVARGVAVASATNRARDLVNEPAAIMTPAALADEATAVASKHANVSVEILGADECRALGMGMFLAVGQGSTQEPRFIHMTYKPSKKAKKKVALIGKGLTFDSGGYSLKPSQSMEDMKIDMSGAAAVISAMDAIATLGSAHEVHVIAACCENMVSGGAYRLGDILRSMDGTTVEINNTDAEGRLTLGDAITYTRTKVEPDEMFDFATLTGACMVALGPYTAGVMSDHERLAKEWLAAAGRAGEDMWRLPLNSRLREQLKSPIADMRNTGDRFGGAITAGLFLKTFVKDTPWLHVDLAGPASTSAPRPSQSKGGTGYAVASIVEYLTR